MARKKSAAKKAREQADKEATNIPESTKVVRDDVKVIEKKDSKPETDEKSENSESDESSSEEEDEYGALITEDVNEGIEKVLAAIKNDPKKLLDPNVKFFNEEDIAKSSNTNKEKPMYLKDYHRINLLSGSYKDDDDMGDNEYGTVDGEKPFAVAQREERMQILSDIKNAFSDEGEEDDDDFLKKKPTVASKVEEDITVLPNPRNETEFLTAFVNEQAWIPKKNDKVIDLDRIDQNDEEDFDNAVENFEHAYNFRYEDPNSAEIVSYARNQATLRRSATNSRKRQREKKLELKEEEEKEKEELLKKKKTLKMNKVMDRLAKIKEAVGEDINDEVIEKVFGDSLLNDDFDDADWDSKMSEIFNEQYYGAEIEKPEWDEDDDIMVDFHEEKKAKENEQEEEEVEEEQPETKNNKKQKLKEKKSSKKEKDSLKEKAKHIVENNSSKILDEIEEERGRSKNKEDVKFKYREVSPESFGLTNRDIFLADDKDLNNFIGIKKFAPYRAKELRMKDKRKYAKKRNLDQWRKETFRGKKHGPDNADTNEVWIPMENSEKPKKKKSKH